MPLFDSGLLVRLHRLWLASRRGRPHRGSDGAAPWRDYSPGDDYRTVDWRYCARHDELLVPRFAPRPDDHVALFLDGSRGMTLAGRFAAACKAATAVAYDALARSEQVVMAAYADRVTAHWGPCRGRLCVGSMLAFLTGLAPEPVSADLAAAAARFVRTRRRPGPAVVISGTHDLAGLQQGLEVLRHHGYKPIVLWIHDPRDAEPAQCGDVEISDAATGRSWQVTLTEADASRYRQVYADHCQSLNRFCASRAIPCTQLAVDLPEDELLWKAVNAV